MNNYKEKIIDSVNYISPLETTKYKILHFIRHGESEYNKWRKESFAKLKLKDIFTYDPMIFDPSLSLEGRNQCKELNRKIELNNLKWISELKLENESKSNTFCFRNDFFNNLSMQNFSNTSYVELLITSPLSRAIETAELTFRGSNLAKNIIVYPGIYEWTLTTSDWGSDITVLKSRFPKCNFSYLEKINKNPWWHHGKLKNYLGFKKITAEPRKIVQERGLGFLKVLASLNENNICVVGHSLFFKEITNETKMSNCEIRSYILNCTNLTISKISNFLS